MNDVHCIVKRKIAFSVRQTLQNQPERIQQHERRKDRNRGFRLRVFEESFRKHGTRKEQNAHQDASGEAGKKQQFREQNVNSFFLFLRKKAGGENRCGLLNSELGKCRQQGEQCEHAVEEAEIRLRQILNQYPPDQVVDDAQQDRSGKGADDSAEEGEKTR